MGKIVKAAVRPVVTILITLAIGAVMIINAGESPFKAYGILFYGAFGTLTGLLNTLAKATPLIFTGLAAALADIVGVFNIGVEGQLYLGALAAAVVGVYAGGLPAAILIPLCLLAAMAASDDGGNIPQISPACRHVVGKHGQVSRGKVGSSHSAQASA